MSAGPELEFRVAIREAIVEEMERDDLVVFFGEDIAAEQGGVFAVTPGIQERFGAERVFDTPISELAITGAAFGAAATGLRPIIEIMFGDFMGLAMDSLVNQSAKYWYLSREQRSVPLVVRSAVGGGGRFGAIHSQTHATWFQGVAGLKIAFPSSPAEAKGLLKAAIRDDNPVIFLEHKRLYSVKGEAPGPGEVLPLGQARVARPGRDLTIVSAGKGVQDALEAAVQLARDDGMTAACSLYRANRLAPLAMNVPRTCRALGELLRPRIEEFWSMHTETNVHFFVESERFCAFLESRIDGGLDVPPSAQAALAEEADAVRRALAESHLEATLR